ncbi:MAG: cation transporter [Acidobacteria bacterium]|nr:MAG: cation transporter [Acidobacteriota bacterium]
MAAQDQLERSSRDISIRRTLVGVLGLNLLVALAKLVVGWLSASISMVADGFHSLTDSASNVVGLIGISAAAKPPDEDHPYGHRKFETLAALIIGGLLAMTAWEVLKSCIERLRVGGAPEVTPLAYVVMGATMIINLAVSSYESRQGEKLESEVLKADAAHTRSDFYSSLAVVLSLIAAHYGYPQLDVVAALAITLIIARAAFKILKENGMLLADTALLPAAEVRKVVLEVSGVESVHKIRTRAGTQGGHADLHIQLRPDMRLDEAHDIGHLVAAALRRELGLQDVLVHVEPPVGHETESLTGRES